MLVLDVFAQADRASKKKQADKRKAAKNRIKGPKVEAPPQEWEEQTSPPPSPSIPLEIYNSKREQKLQLEMADLQKLKASLLKKMAEGSKDATKAWEELEPKKREKKLKEELAALDREKRMEIEKIGRASCRERV